MERLDVTCMHLKCPIILTEIAIYPLVSGPLGKRLEMVMLDCSVLSHPKLRFCPGADCDKIILALEAPSPRRVTVNIMTKIQKSEISLFLVFWLQLFMLFSMWAGVSPSL